jgi:hypothetical protein
MGKHLLREDKECQNCGDVVEKKYCPNCGQKNTETRQSFGHLFAHFIEDLTHYDTAFWKTIKYLLFRPARLTQEYLMGKRQSYVPPVKLYIFISFITFFLPAVLPDAEHTVDYEQTKHVVVTSTEEISPKPSLNEVEDILPNFLDFNTQQEYEIRNPLSYTSIEQMDSIEALKPDSLRLEGFEYKVARKLITLYNHNTPVEVGQKFKDSFYNNLPKALFFYLPIFAFWLWLFHGKKRWYYFDHGIFTLHYFSYLLLVTSVLILMHWLSDLLDVTAFRIFNALATFAAIIWQIYYFFRAHRKMYREGWIVNFLKSGVMFIINMISIIAILVIFGFITIYNLH